MQTCVLRCRASLVYHTLIEQQQHGGVMFMFKIELPMLFRGGGVVCELLLRCCEGEENTTPFIMLLLCSTFLLATSTLINVLSVRQVHLRLPLPAVVASVEYRLLVSINASFKLLFKPTRLNRRKATAVSQPCCVIVRNRAKHLDTALLNFILAT